MKLQLTNHLATMPAQSRTCAHPSFPALCRVRRHRYLAPARALAQLVVAGLVCAAAPLASPSAIDPRLPYRARQAAVVADQAAPFVAEAAQRFGIPATWIDAIIFAESAGNVRAVSPAGAMGLMQIMPATWATMRARYGLGDDIFDPHDNIVAGVAYARELLDRYGAPGFLAAYNAGPARYDDHLATGRPLPSETQAYVAALAPVISGTRQNDGPPVAIRTVSWADAPLFNAPSDRHAGELYASFTPPENARPNTQNQAHSDALSPQSAGLFINTHPRISAP